MNATPVQVKPTKDGKEKAYFASGCFWCVEAVYESVKGVQESISGYSGGHTKNPTYESSNTGLTGHAEAVEIIYDPDVVHSFASEVKSEMRLDYLYALTVADINATNPTLWNSWRATLLRHLYIECRKMLLAHPQVNETADLSRVRVIKLAEYSIKVQVRAHGESADV